MKKISKRLKTVASFINKGSIIIDVGTDHALIPMYLIENKISRYAIASDIVPSICINVNKEVIDKGLNDNIKVICMDGLNDVCKKLKQINFDKKIDTVLIAGMGGVLISDIIANAKKFIDDKTLVLSPHRDVDKVRKTLHKLDFKIIKEDIIEDVPGKFYTIIKAKKGKEEKYTEIEYLLGKKLINKKKDNECFIKFLKSEIRKISIIATKMKLSKNTEKELEKTIQLKKKYEETLARITRYSNE